MGNEMKTVKVSVAVFRRLEAIQKTLSEQAANAAPGVSARMVMPTLGSVVEVVLDGFERGQK